MIFKLVCLGIIQHRFNNRKNEPNRFENILTNTSVLALNFTNIELGLKILLTIVAIGYTATKWWLMIKENKNG